MFESDVDPVEYVEEKGLKTVGDGELLGRAAREAMAANPRSVADYRGGKEKALGFLVGQVMKALGGKADPVGVAELLRELLRRDETGA